MEHLDYVLHNFVKFVAIRLYDRVMVILTNEKLRLAERLSLFET